jgi:CRP/FNR family cyclic AMP-dependent transcriptional regulator
MNKTSGLFRNASDFEEHRAGGVIFATGAAAGCMYVVKAGAVAIQVDGVTVETVGEGGIVGEMALLDDAPRSATVVAVTDCELVPVDKKRFLFMVQQTPFFALEVMREMAERLRSMNQRLSRSS